MAGRVCGRVRQKRPGQPIVVSLCSGLIETSKLHSVDRRRLPGVRLEEGLLELTKVESKSHGLVRS